MNQTNKLYFSVTLGIGVMIGFFGSIANYLELLLAPVFGFALVKALEQARGVPYLITIFAMTIGIFLGGIPMWALVITSLEATWVRLGAVFMAPILVLAGVGLAILVDWICLLISKIKNYKSIKGNK